MPILRNGSAYYKNKEGVEPVRTAGHSRDPPIPRPSPAPALASNGTGSQTSESASQRSTSPSITINEEEDRLLDEPSMEVDIQEKKSLLALRQAYKKAKSNLDRSNSHFEFLQECVEKENAPKGLNVNVKCNALMSDCTDVQVRFDNTKKYAEKEYTTALRGHYVAVRRICRDQVDELKKEMETELSKASMEEKQTHQLLIDKTEENLSKQRKQLDERKRRKLETIGKPEEKKTREGRKPIHNGYAGQGYQNYRQRQKGGSRRYTHDRPKGRNQPERHNIAPRQQPQQNTSNPTPQLRGPPAQVNQTNGPPGQGPPQFNGPQVQGPPQFNGPQLQGPPVQTNQGDMTTVVTLLNKLIQQGNQAQQPPMLLQPHPCAVGQQPPQLHAPTVRVPARQPPPLLNRYQQDFQ